jgi:hypothetical protein
MKGSKARLPEPRKIVLRQQSIFSREGKCAWLKNNESRDIMRNNCNFNPEYYFKNTITIKI